MIQARVLLLLCSLGWAVTAPGQTFTPQSISFEGAPQYGQADLLRMSGLAPGKQLTAADIDAAMQRMDATGLFAGIKYGTANGVLRFELEPMAGAKVRRARYANFVMFKPEELAAEIHQRLPLFDGTVPVTGGMQKDIEQALSAVLKAHGIDATVTSISATDGVDYSIQTPPVLVGKVNVEGVNLGSDANLETIRKRVEGSEYSEEYSAKALAENLVDAYRDLGYVDIVVDRVTHGAPSVEPNRIVVDLVGSARTGPRYTVAKLGLPAGVPGVPQGEIEGAMQLKVGGPASRILLLSTIGRLNGAFSSHGYLDAASAAEQTKDTTAHTVAYTLQTNSGEVYHMRSVGAPGFSEEQQAMLAHAWKIPPGAVFERANVSAFLQTPGVRTMCSGKPIEVGTRPDRGSHLVDVTLACRR